MSQIIETVKVNGISPVDGDPLAHIQELVRISKVEAEQPAQAAAGRRFTPLSLRDLRALPPKEWMIDQLLGRGDLVMVYGAPGCGKTFVVIDLIFAACLGQRFAMRFDVARPLNVAYAAGEGISGLPSRFAAAAEFYAIDDLPNFTFYAETPQLAGDDSAYINSIGLFVKEWKERQDAGQAQPLDILIIDTLHSATAGADENSAKDMGLVLKVAKDAAQALGCAVVLVHHTNKNGTAERGSSALRGAMDCMIEIRRIYETGTKAAMQCAKLKDGQEWKEQTLDLVESGESVRVWWDEPSDSKQADRRKTETANDIIRLLTTAKGPLTNKQICEALATKPNSTNDVLARLTREKTIEREQNERGTWCYTVPAA